jgi:DsbC/DsbD-like thiol-disulfide interchange protein
LGGCAPDNDATTRSVAANETDNDAIGSIAIVSSAQAQQPPAATSKDSIVKATLVADTTAVQPGTTFTLGVLYEMQPEWHIYWKNPGGSGFATTVQWGLPPGASVSETQYPAPVAFESPGPVISYGYEDETLLMVEAQAAELPENGQVQITAKSRWLMCSDRCIPNSKELTLSLPVGDGKPANQELFNKYRKLIPNKVGELPNNVEVAGTPNGGTMNFSMTITPPEGKKLLASGDHSVFPAYFYPNDEKDYVIEPPKAEGTIAQAGALKVYEGPVKITWKADPGNNTAEPLKRLAGTLAYQTVSGTAPDEPVLLEINQDI